MRVENPETKFPVHLDAQPLFLFWEVDEILPVVASFVIFLPTRQLWLGAFIAIILAKLYKKYKKKYYSNFIYHLLWIYGIWSPKKAKKGYIRYYRE